MEEHREETTGAYCEESVPPMFLLHRYLARGSKSTPKMSNSAPFIASWRRSIIPCPIQYALTMTSAIVVAFIGSSEKATVKVAINQTYPLTEAAQAHRDLEARKMTGATILLPSYSQSSQATAKDGRVTVEALHQAHERNSCTRCGLASPSFSLSRL